MKIAWVGNSYVYFNDLPAMVEGLLLSADVRCLHDQRTPGGQTLLGHSKDPIVGELLAKEAWDFVVLQDNSAVPGGARVDRRNASLDALKQFFLPRIAKGSIILLYGTWGHKNGSAYPDFQKEYPDYETMQKKTTEGLKRHYMTLLPSTAIFVPVGDAFRQAFRQDRALFERLYAPDTFHTSRLGTFLAACTFFCAITGKSPIGSPYIPDGCPFDSKCRAKKGWSEDEFPLEISPEDARKLQTIAWTAYQKASSSL